MACAKGGALSVNDSRRINDFSLHSTTRRSKLNRHVANKDKRRITIFLDKYLVKFTVYTDRNGVYCPSVIEARNPRYVVVR